ncbi:hypothetical protein BO94DRAFT_570909 [Aspergillus sclerotioniger CBS 115572]|uniref:UbiA prenyltransferase n=1 Tax=Aspergillus sclerotioniger CBS 115572 TaxID=1450535 RepID=A0A317XDE3_9EURO|nr:hypothetical protein BO94DRAFT_570909 [Aspergillus sclerotioniger CBS 115572]PWY96634.1 hypothetical protein BO94DRAFT_570909 [Aspergillus sclerotioniger CBS 115572]
MKPTKEEPSLRLHHLPILIWHFTESNFPTFVIPNSLFGFLGALSGSALTTAPSPPSFVPLLCRLPLIILFNWATVFIFDLANQRLPESILEDQLNKPWRPLPTHRISATQTRRLMLAAIPAVLALNYTLGVWHEATPILLLTWLYNDLKGGDEIIRDAIIAVAYGLYNTGSLRIACGGESQPSEQGYVWIGMVSGVILTTMQIQDLKDQAGDRARARQTIPLVLGEQWSRGLIGGFVVGWSGVCVWFWALPGWCYLLVGGVGGMVVVLVLRSRSVERDALAWRVWCAWLVGLYLLPCLRGVA